MCDTTKFAGRYAPIEEYASALRAMHRQYGPIVREYVGAGRGHVVHLFDAADVQTLFAAEDRQPYITPLQDTVQLYRQMRGISPGLGNM